MCFEHCDPLTQPVPIRPTCHYTMGGIDVVDYKTCACELPGLFRFRRLLISSTVLTAWVVTPLADGEYSVKYPVLVQLTMLKHMNNQM